MCSWLLQELLEKSRAGVVASLLGACAREGVQQAAACQALAAAVRELNAQDAVSSRHALLPRGSTSVCLAITRRSTATEVLRLLCMSHDVPSSQWAVQQCDITQQEHSALAAGGPVGLLALLRLC